MYLIRTYFFKIGLALKRSVLYFAVISKNSWKFQENYLRSSLEEFFTWNYQCFSKNKYFFKKLAFEKILISENLQYEKELEKVRM